MHDICVLPCMCLLRQAERYSKIKNNAVGNVNYY